MKITLAILLALAVAGCQSSPTRVNITTGSIPKAFLNCPKQKDFPKPETLTNQQIAEIIQMLKSKLEVCNINMDKIIQYEQAKNK